MGQLLQLDLPHVAKEKFEAHLSWLVRDHALQFQTMYGHDFTLDVIRVDDFVCYTFFNPDTNRSLNVAPQSLAIEFVSWGIFRDDRLSVEVYVVNEEYMWWHEQILEWIQSAFSPVPGELSGVMVPLAWYVLDRWTFSRNEAKVSTYGTSANFDSFDSSSVVYPDVDAASGIPSIDESTLPALARGTQTSQSSFPGVPSVSHEHTQSSPKIDEGSHDLNPLALRKAQLAVVSLLLEGKTYSMIANDLVISVNTVRTHMKEISNKAKEYVGVTARLPHGGIRKILEEIGYQ